MNLDNLKPAWQQFKLWNSIQVMDQEEILSIINHAEDSASRGINRLLMNATMFIILAVCCQGG